MKKTLFVQRNDATDNLYPIRSYRSTDPDTSRLADEEIEKSGRAGCQRDLCLAEVRRQPGQTSAEIAQSLGLERHVPARRLPELRFMGLVRNQSIRKCNVTGKKCVTWWP